MDFVERTVGTTATTGFPIYDAHGNNVGTLIRNGTGYAVPASDLRRYGAWGSVRSGNPTGDPKGKFCASLGHRQDDESGLTYMRARYYEPDSGRFLSQDSHAQGWNWFAYCGNDPVNKVDQSGNDALKDIAAVLRIVTTPHLLEFWMKVSGGTAEQVIRNYIQVLDDIIGRAEDSAAEWNTRAAGIEASMGAGDTAESAQEKMEMARDARAIAGENKAVVIAGMAARYQLEMVLKWL